MRKFYLAIVVFILIGAMAYAQQPGGNINPSPAQVRQNAQQFLTQSRANLAQFEATLNELRGISSGNRDQITFNQLRLEILNLETLILSEEGRLTATINRGGNISQMLIDRVDVLIGQHRAKLAELEAFIAN